MGYADIEKTASGYLVNVDDWSEDVARDIAAADGVGELTPRHFDVLAYLRDEFINNGGNQPNERHMVKAMSEKWGESVSTKDLYTMFVNQPSKQATKIAGLPETKRKGGY